MTMKHRFINSSIEKYLARSLPVENPVMTRVLEIARDVAVRLKEERESGTRLEEN
jgi:hypothetical protein